VKFQQIVLLYNTAVRESIRKGECSVGLEKFENHCLRKWRTLIDSLMNTLCVTSSVISLSAKNTTFILIYLSMQVFITEFD
jgi:hypothetical protein